MMVRISPASIYSSTDSRGMLRSRSALTARSFSRGASARARSISSAPLGKLCTGAADDSVSTALMRVLPYFYGGALRSLRHRANALIVDRQREPASLEARQVAHEERVHAEPIKLGDIARKQRPALLGGDVGIGELGGGGRACMTAGRG